MLAHMAFNWALVVQTFVLINPLASFPFLISAYNQKMNLKLIALKATMTAFVIAVIMAIAGPPLFSVFGITLDSFRVAGGIVLLLLGLHMVNPKEEDEPRKHPTGLESLVTLIATPMLTGPGTISFITVKSYEIGKTAMLIDLCGAFILVGMVFFIFTLLVSRVDAKIVNIMSRIMGLFLMAVAIEMIAKGIYGIIWPLVVAGM